MIATGLFDLDRGLFYVGSFDQLGIQCIGAIALSLRTALFSYAFFILMKKADRLRMGEVFEIIGMDTIEEIELKTRTKGICDFKPTYQRLVKLERKQRNMQE